MARSPRDLVVRFVADVLPFLKDTRKVEDAFQDMVDAQDTLVREGKDATQDLGRAYERMSDKVKRENREIERDTKQTFREAGKEAGDEFAQNLGESISGGDIGGLISGTVGGLVGTFGKGGPIALAIGALGAVSVGIFQQMQQAALDAAAAAQAAFDNIQSGAERQAVVQTQLETAFKKGDYVSNLAAARDAAAKLGIPLEEVVNLIADGNRGQRRLIDLQAEVDRLARKNVETAGDLTAAESSKLRAGEDYLDAVRKSSDAINGATKANEDTRRIAGLTADAAERRAVAEERAARAAERSLSALSSIYRNGYGVGSSVYNSQLGAAAPYVKGSR